MATKQITVWGQNRPGNLSQITSVLAAKSVNITGLYASDAKGRSPVRLLVSNAGRAKAALKAAGFRITEEPIVVLKLSNKPGELDKVASKLARARVNIGYAYATVSPAANRACIVLGVNTAAARRALR